MGVKSHSSILQKICPFIFVISLCVIFPGVALMFITTMLFQLLYGFYRGKFAFPVLFIAVLIVVSSVFGLERVSLHTILSAVILACIVNVVVFSWAKSTQAWAKKGSYKPDMRYMWAVSSICTVGYALCAAFKI